MPDTKKGIQLANNVTELTAIAPLVPGGADRLRAFFTKRRRDDEGGEPSPIEQIETIHYARWVIIDGGTRLLFTSNFDGDIEGYLSEFAERDEGPLNAIFGFCDGWPGARPVASFIEYVRKHMVPAEYYYGAYPKNTVKEIKRALYWYEKTEGFIRGLLPKLADLADAKEYLESQGFDVKTVETIREKIREFLAELAIPTPEDFGKVKPNAEEVPS